MGSIVIDDQTLKGLFKEALAEVLQERPDLLRDALPRAIEDLGLAGAIREGEQTELVARDAALGALE